MKRILSLLGTLICTSSFYGASAEAQCGEKCTVVVNEALEVIGHGCVLEPDFHTTCTATAYRCTSNSCGGLGLVVDIEGTALASAPVCGSQMRDFVLIQIIPAQPTAAASTTRLAPADWTQVFWREAPANGALDGVYVTEKVIAAESTPPMRASTD